MKDLSIIVPFANEGALAVMTAQGLANELDGTCDYEIVMIDNCSAPTMTLKIGPKEWTVLSRAFWYNPDKQHHIKTQFFRDGRMKYLRYDERQSHWCAKNYGIAQSTGRYVFFVDAHTLMKPGSLLTMMQFLRETEGQTFECGGVPYKVGAVHAYINYMLDSRCLEYRPKYKTFGYEFCTHQSEVYYQDGRRLTRFPTKPYQVCVMSTCGMMCPRSVLTGLGGWNPEFGTRVGGEAYMNYKQATCGYGHWIHPEAWCWHVAEKRGYPVHHSDSIRNSLIAAYTIGGDEYLDQQTADYCRHNRPGVVRPIAEDVRSKCRADREFIAARQIVSFDDYMKYWLHHPGTWK